MDERLRGGLMRLTSFAVAVVALPISVGLAVLLAAALLVSAVVGGALFAMSTLALRARRRLRPATMDPSGVIEARQVGHTWVAYAWNESRR